MTDTDKAVAEPGRRCTAAERVAQGAGRSHTAGRLMAFAKIAVIAFLAVACALLGHSVALLIADLQLNAIP